MVNRVDRGKLKSNHYLMHLICDISLWLPLNSHKFTIFLAVPSRETPHIRPRKLYIPSSHSVHKPFCELKCEDKLGIGARGKPKVPVLAASSTAPVQNRVLLMHKALWNDNLLQMSFHNATKKVQAIWSKYVKVEGPGKRETWHHNSEDLAK